MFRDSEKQAFWLDECSRPILPGPYSQTRTVGIEMVTLANTRRIG